MAWGEVSDKTNGDGAIQVHYSAPDGSGRVPDSLLITYGAQGDDITARLYDAMIFHKYATYADIRFRRMDTNTWVGSGQGLHFQWLAIWTGQ